MVNIWNLPDDVRQRLLSIPDHDQVLAKVLSRGGVVLGFIEKRDALPGRTPVRSFRVVNAGGSPLPYLREIDGAVSSVEILETAAQGNGALIFIPDADGVVRR